MATFFSDHYTATGVSQSAVDRRHKVAAGAGHGRLRYKKVNLTGLVTNSDHARFATFKSSDRIIEILVSASGASTAGDLNIGLHLAGNNHDGAVIDMDLFASALATAGALARQEAFKEATTLTDLDRGEPIWSLNTGHALWTADPGIEIDLTGTPTTTFTDTAEVLTVEVLYTSGD